MLSLQNKQLINLVVFGFILLFRSPLAFAQWTGIASSSNRGGYVVYIDHSLSSTLDGISELT